MLLAVLPSISLLAVLKEFYIIASSSRTSSIEVHLLQSLASIVIESKSYVRVEDPLTTSELDKKTSALTSTSAS
jgi:hypothetical protein